MSHQGEEGWYPECKDCGCGNLGEVVCIDCHNKVKDKLKKEQEKKE